MGKRHVPHAGREPADPAPVPTGRNEKLTFVAGANPIPVCSFPGQARPPINCGRAALWLWTDSACSCGDSANHIS